MIKIKAKYDEKNDIFNYNYKIKNSNTIEHLAIIWKLIDAIIDNDKNIDEKTIIKMIKDRKKYMETIEGDE